MSVDDRLREAFGSTDTTEWERTAPTALRSVTTRRDRERLVRRGAAVGLAAAVAVGVVAVVANGRGGEETDPEPVGPPPTTPTQLESMQTGAPMSPLDGRWKSGPITAADVRVALTRLGHAELADETWAALPPAPFRLVWVVHGDGSELEVIQHGEVNVVDEEDLVVEAGRLTLSPRFAAGDTVHEWVVDGNELDLTFVSTTEGVADGVPGEVWHRLLYDSVVYRR